MARILNSSDCSFCVEFGNEISEQINDQVRAYTMAVEAAGIEGVTELVPTYRSVTVHYRPEVIGWSSLYTKLSKLTETLGTTAFAPAETVSIPVLYGGDCGPDLAALAKAHGMTEQEVVALHTAPEYLIYMMGFLPGFCYLGGLDKSIATPRLKTPRVKIPAGSVGIAGEQTGMYPLESPGGWQLIGMTPLKLYDPQRERPILLEAGNRLKFYAIGREEYLEIRRREYPEEFCEGGAV